jgi:glycosyltransferase involved in cell wall biosynthesis
MKSILFYDDASSSGGHEVTTVDAVKYLLYHTELDVSFLFYKNNTKLGKHLELLQQSGGRIRLYSIPYTTGKLRTVGALLSVGKVRKIQSLISKINPDVVIIAQGGIEGCCLGLLAAKRSGYKTISFIPLAPKLSTIQSKFAGAREFINRYFYKLPNGFITTSNHVKDMLIQHQVKSPISVAYYGIDLNLYPIQDKQESRLKYGIDDQDYVVALIGRIVFSHKAHDFLIDTPSKYLDKLENIKLIIVGEGPDEDLLRSMVNNTGLSHLVQFIPWKNDLSYIYSAIDMLIIPSRFEGLPLVMLEAMYYSLPIVASNRDGMAELLPKEWLFQPYDSDSLIETMLSVKTRDNIEFLSKHKLRVIKQFNVEAFQKEFYDAIGRH